MGSGQWAMGNGQWAMGSGQWATRDTLQAGWVCAQLHSSINQLHAALICNDCEGLQELLHACTFSTASACVLEQRLKVSVQ